MRRMMMLALLSVCPLASYAQRTAEGTQFVEATAAYTFSSLGGSAAWGMYFRDFYVTAGVNFAARAKTLSGDEMRLRVPYLQYTAAGACLYRLCAAKSRWFTLDAGGGVLLGAETVDPCGQAPEDVALTNAGTGFIYGVDARVEMEFYFTRTLGFVAGGRLPLTFGSRCAWFNYEVYAGLRFNL